MNRQAIQSKLVDPNATASLTGLANDAIGLKDILQADATLIAGMLILLSITSLLSGRAPRQATSVRSFYLIAMLGCIAMFAISAASAVTEFKLAAVLSFAAGLASLVVAIGGFARQLLEATDNGNTEQTPNRHD